jgi:hypothetical protein
VPMGKVVEEREESDPHCTSPSDRAHCLAVLRYLAQGYVRTFE